MGTVTVNLYGTTPMKLNLNKISFVDHKTIQKKGSSLGITFPTRFLRDMGINEGTPVVMMIDRENGTIIIKQNK
jgi:bifunctional DNA-binding transcriptional regulator/antitoxin component of YhaV-PrlF toxin-antitoxin module